MKNPKAGRQGREEGYQVSPDDRGYHQIKHVIAPEVRDASISSVNLGKSRLYAMGRFHHKGKHCHNLFMKHFCLLNFSLHVRGSRDCWHSSKSILARRKHAVVELFSFCGL